MFLENKKIILRNKCFQKRCLPFTVGNIQYILKFITLSDIWITWSQKELANLTLKSQIRYLEKEMKNSKDHLCRTIPEI
jgi:hypothetical protein